MYCAFLDDFNYYMLYFMSLFFLILDALDGLEFAMGSEESAWGSIRAAMGHPERFPLKYVAIGNEDCLKEFYQGT